MTGPVVSLRELSADLKTQIFQNFKRIGCAKSRLLWIGRVEVNLIEAAIRRCSSKQVILKIQQDSLENTCAGASF